MSSLEHRPAGSANPHRGADAAIAGALAAFAGVPDAIVGTDAEWRVTAWNPAAERFFGISAADAIGHTIASLADMEAPFATAPLVAVAAALESGGRWTGRTTYRMKGSGRVVTGDVEVARIAGPDGSFGGGVAVIRDVTASARLEAAFGGLATIPAAGTSADARTSADAGPSADRVAASADVASPGDRVAAPTAGAADPGGHASIEAIATDALGVLVETTGCSHAAIVSIDANGQVQLVAQVGVPAEASAGFRGMRRRGIVTELLRTGERLLMGPLALLRLEPAAEALLEQIGIAEIATLPLSSEGDPEPTFLWLAWPRGATPPTPFAVRQAGSIIATALDNARRMATVRADRRRAERLVAHLDSLVDLAEVRAADAAGPVRDERLVRRTMELLGADAGMIADVVGQSLVVRAAVDLPPALVRLLEQTPIAVFGRDAQASEAAHPSRLTRAPEGADPVVVDAFRAAGYRVAVTIPVNLDGRLERLAVFLTRDPGAADIRTLGLRSIAHILAVAVANGVLADKLLASEARYRDLFEHAPDAIVVQTPDGRIVAANRAAETVFRRSRADLVGRPIAELTTLEPAARVAPGRPAEPGDGNEQRGYGLRADGARFLVEVHSARVDLDGEPRIMLQIRDLAERERINEQLLQAQKMETIGALVGGVRHELNNPLAVVKGYAELLLTDGDLPPGAREDARRIRDAGERAISLVATFADFAREGPSTRQAFELRDLIDGILALMRFDLMQPLRPRSSAGAIVAVTIARGLPRVVADRGRIEQVLLTLLQNSLDAFRARATDLPDPIGVVGRVEIVAELVGGRIHCRVSDDGPGIPETLLGRPFTPFATSKPNGRGLGLWVAARLAAANGGSLVYDRSMRPGATFVLELPAAAPGLASAQVREPSSATLAPLPDAGSVETPAPWSPEPLWFADATLTRAPDPNGLPDEPPWVLVVDDEPWIRDLVRRILSGEGWNVALAATGDDALMQARSHNFDIVLMDHRMPGLSGVAVYRELVSSDPSYRGRIALMSGNEEEPELEALGMTEGLAILRKPFSTAALTPHLRAFLDTAGRRA